MNVKRFSLPGVGLIMVGATMLLDRFNVIRFDWSTVLWGIIALYGFVKAIDGNTRKKSGRVFLGTFFFLLGLYNILCNLEVIAFRSYWWMPVLLLIIGFSILMVYVTSPKDWHMLVPAILLLGSGTAVILAEFGYLYRYDVAELLRTYWPIGLILFGIALIARHLSWFQATGHETTSSPVP